MILDFAKLLPDSVVAYSANCSSLRTVFLMLLGLASVVDMRRGSARGLHRSHPALVAGAVAENAFVTETKATATTHRNASNRRGIGGDPRPSLEAVVKAVGARRE